MQNVRIIGKYVGFVDVACIFMQNWAEFEKSMFGIFHRNFYGVAKMPENLNYVQKYGYPIISLYSSL